MGIRVVNIEKYKKGPNEILINIENTILHSPYKVKLDTKNERKLLCNAYKEYFYNSLETNSEFKNKINEIIELHKNHDIALGCHCFPKQCCTEIICQYVLAYNKQKDKISIVHK